MASRKHRRRRLFLGLSLALLMGMVVVPALLSLSVGIVAIALWREAFDIVLGVLILSFAASAIAGGVFALIYVRRSARLAELQADFVANVSHELRSPLAGVRLVAETLEAGRGDDPARLGVLTEMLGDEVRRLEELIERVLAWRHLDSDPPRSPVEVVSVAEVAHEAIAGIVRLPEARGVTIDLAIPHDLPPVLGDRSMLGHALRNLAHNAVKFAGDRGPIKVVAAYEPPHVLVTVKDRGPGIEASEQKRIFDRFYRGGGRCPSVAGTGLGLDIVRTVVERHGGQVTVDSAPGQGAAFTIRLPVPPKEELDDA